MKYNYFEPEIQWKASQFYKLFIWIGYENLTTYENQLGSVVVLAEDLEQARWFMRQAEAINYKADVFEHLPTLTFRLASQQRGIRPFVLVCPSDGDLKKYLLKQGDIVLDRFKG